jgi:hypothetical protein
MLQSINPRYGSVEGGTEVTFAGTGFTNNAADIKILIDGINCPVT